MDTRSSIDALLDQAYAARRKQDAVAAAACFTEDGCFRAVNGPGTQSRTEQLGALQGIFEAFDLVEFEQFCRVIDPPRAVVHWRGKFRMKGGRTGETDVLDLIEVRDGKIASLTTFFDTALAAALSNPG